jgi:hypothetical protein
MPANGSEVVVVTESAADENGIAQICHFELWKCLYTFAATCRNQFEYHTCNSPIFKHLPGEHQLIAVEKAT